jgi:hypothetical protein
MNIQSFVNNSIKDFRADAKATEKILEKHARNMP